MASLTPAQIIDTLTQISREIDEQTDEIAELDEALVRAKVAYEVAFAKAFLATDGSMDVKKYSARLETADLFLALELAEQVHRASVGSLRALRDRLEVGRSLGPLVRLEWGQ